MNAQFSRLAYLGPAGTNTEEAARSYLERQAGRGEGLSSAAAQGSSAAAPVAARSSRGSARAEIAEAPTDLVPLAAVSDILWAVHRGEVDEGVVPLENSLEGAVAVTLDMLAHEVRLQIRGEVVLPIRHALLVRPGEGGGPGEGGMDQIGAVYSHPQALAQCRKSLDRLLPGARRIPTASTAEAARWVAEDGGAVKESHGEVPPGGGGGARGAMGTGCIPAAIATHLAGRIYELDVLKGDLQDRTENATRFVVVGREDAAPSGRAKSSIVVGGKADRPGVLHRILQAFAEREINLTRIESRPAKRALGEYLFFIDLEGHRTDPVVWDALHQVEKQCEVFRVLGSYPAWR